MIEARVGGYPYRVDGTTVSRRVRGSWADLTRAELLALPRDGAVWEWLRAQGIKRPSPSGKSGATLAESSRTGDRVRLSNATIERADELAARWGVSRPEAIAKAVLEALR